MSFRTIAVITAIVTLVLGAGYLFAGTLLVGRWQIEPTASVLLLGRRLGALYLGLCVIFFLARSAPVSAARTALGAGTAAACSMLAFLSVYEFSAGRTGPAILASAAVEALLAIGYIRILVTERRVANGA
ncbi:MAG: hypothetical protein EPN53_09695 [Acidobacteria bacterium]|nr:MAG: hypothetical protein EPN53_09695 [Acidobacteriota bacterium]